MTYFVPTCSIKAGACLTMDNWQAAGISHLAYDLSHLLIKPGIEVLQQYKNLASYVGSDHQLVLNAASLTSDKEGSYRLRSSFDGSWFTFSIEDLTSIMVQLAPDYVLLPSGFSLKEASRLPKKTKIFWSHTSHALKEAPAEMGVYVKASFSDRESLKALLPIFTNRPKYVILGSLDISSYDARHQGRLSDWSEMDVMFVESDQPAFDAIHGFVYTSNSVLSLQDKSERVHFDVIEATCRCQTCCAGFTRAYLHHLYQETPLLCHRLLIQHNIFMCSQSFT